MDNALYSVAPAAGMIPGTGEVAKKVESGCQQRSLTGVRDVEGLIEEYSGKLLPEHSVAARNIKTFGDYIVKAARATGAGIQAVSKGIISIHDRITKQYQAVTQFVQSRHPKASVAVKCVSEFALNSVTNAFRGLAIGHTAGLVCEATFGFAATLPYSGLIVTGGAVIGVGYGLLKGALNSARYTLKLEGAEQHPYLARAVSLCDRVLSPFNKADRFMEGLHPALSIPYKAIKEFTILAVNVPACWLAGALTSITLFDAYGGNYGESVLVDSVADLMLVTTVVGGIVLGAAKPIRNIGKFSYHRLSEHMRPKTEPVVTYYNEADPGCMV